MALKWLTVMVDSQPSALPYSTQPREAESYEAARRRAVANLELFTPQTPTRAGRFVGVPRYTVHTLLDLDAGDLDDVELERLISTVPLFQAVFEAGRIVGHLEAAEREQ